MRKLRLDAIKPTKVELERLYSKEGLSVNNIAKRCRVTNRTVEKWIKNEGLEYRGIGPRKLPKDFVRPSKEKLDEMYNKAMCKNYFLTTT